MPSQYQSTPSPPQISANERQQAMRNVTLVGAVVNFFMAIAQLFGGFISGSQALVADAMHTLADLVSDGIVLIAGQQANKAADANHPYGHGRIETIATVVLGLLLAIVAVGIFLPALNRLLGDETLVAPQPIALGFAGLALVLKEALYHYTLRIAKHVRSPLLEANAWHHRSDAISSLVVFVGIAGAQFGLPWLDTVAAMVVAVMILFMAGRMILDSTMELVDTGLDPERAEALTAYIRSLDGVDDVHLLRTRTMAGQVVADVHIQVGSYLSVSEGHYIAEYVSYSLKKQFAEFSDVTVHVDPENDEETNPNHHLPSRRQWQQDLSLDPQLHAIWPKIKHIQAHYVSSKLRLDCYVDTQIDSIQLEAFLEGCNKYAYLGEVRFYKHLMCAE